jgi:hypothetical protein
MKYRLLLLGISLFALSMPTIAQDTVYGRDLMTERERIEHQEKMRSFGTEDERELYRKQHHEQMRKRAEERGMKLPDSPDLKHDGMGRSGGMGSGGSMGGGGGGRGR